jgi:hypothetical protein
MEWYTILTLVLTCIVTLASVFVVYKTRVITNFKTLFDKEWNEADLQAIADLLNISVEVVIKFLAIFGITINLPDT